MSLIQNDSLSIMIRSVIQQIISINPIPDHCRMLKRTMIIDLSLYNTMISFVLSFESIASFSSLVHAFTDTIMEMVSDLTDNRGPYILSLLMKPTLLHLIPSIESAVVETTNFDDSAYICSILENCARCRCDALLLQMIENMKSFSGKQWIEVLKPSCIRECPVIKDSLRQVFEYILCV